MPKGFRTLSIGNLKHERQGVFLMQEIWKPVPFEQFCDYCSVSNLGNVKLTKQCRKTHVALKPGLLKPQIGEWGYAIVNLQSPNEYKRISVHRLVALTFIPNPLNKPQVNHIDGNKLNNCVDNLEWVTVSENLKHAYKNGLNYYDPNSYDYLPVYQFDLNGNYIQKFSTCAEAGRILGIDSTSISACCHNRRNSAGGFLFSRSKECNPKPLKTVRHHTNIPVIQYDLKGNLINVFSSAKDASKALKISLSPICACCRGSLKTYKGFIWKYEGE